MDVDYGEYLRFTMGQTPDSKLEELQQEVASGGQISQLCIDATWSFLEHVKNATPYTQNVLDSYGRPPSGILRDNNNWLGSYTQCMETHQYFSGVHCQAQVRETNVTEGTWLGMCVPEVCNISDVVSYTNYMIQTLPIPNIISENAVCATTKAFSAGDWFASVLCILLALLVIAGTITDLTLRRKPTNKPPRTSADRSEKSHANNRDDPAIELNSHGTRVENDERIEPGSAENQKPSKPKQLILAFSWVTNLGRLLDTTIKPGNLQCLNGIRVLSMSWIILGHTYYFLYNYAGNKTDLLATYDGFASQAIVNGALGVDTFLLLSGLLVSYLTLKKFKKNSMGARSRAFYYLHRYWRLSPVYFFVILLWSTLFLQILRGPWMRTFDYESEICQSYFWTNMLYINNLWPLAGGCMNWSWYIAMDMQYYAFSLPFVYLLFRHRKAGLAFYGCMIAIGLIIRFGIAMGLGVYPGIVNPLGDLLIYFKPMSRYTPYITGVLTGYLLCEKGGKVKLSKAAVVVGWCVSVIVGLLTVYGLYFYSDDVPMPLVVSALYLCFFRFAWSLAVAWLIVACLSGYGGYIDDFLSWRVWLPLGRLTYSCYLLHPLVMYYFYLQASTPVYVNDLSMTYLFLGHLVLTNQCAIPLVLTLEYPMMALEKLIFPGFFSRPKSEAAPSTTAADAESPDAAESPDDAESRDVGSSEPAI